MSIPSSSEWSDMEIELPSYGQALLPMSTSDTPDQSEGDDSLLGHTPEPPQYSSTETDGSDEEPALRMPPRRKSMSGSESSTESDMDLPLPPHGEDFMSMSTTESENEANDFPRGHTPEPPQYPLSETDGSEEETPLRVTPRRMPMSGSESSTEADVDLPLPPHDQDFMSTTVSETSDRSEDETLHRPVPERPPYASSDENTSDDESTSESTSMAQHRPPMSDSESESDVDVDLHLYRRPVADETNNEINKRIADIISKLIEDDIEAPNLSQIAKKYDVPYQRLRARWLGRPTLNERPANNRNLNDGQELSLCMYLDRLDKIGTSALFSMVTGAANDILNEDYDPASGEPIREVSPHWTRRFLARHPEFKIRKQQSMEATRHAAHSRASIGAWFDKLQKVLHDFDIQPSDIYNMDESGFRVGIGRDQRVVTKSKTAPVYLGSKTSRETVTLVEVISADGARFPPLIIVPGKRKQYRWFANLSDKYELQVTPTGYTNDQLTYAWVQKFHEWTRYRRQGPYRLLIMDGYGSHCTRQFVEFCNSKFILPFALPPHTSQLLQPLDVVVFQPYKKYHSNAIEEATRTGCTNFDKLEFLTHLHEIRKKALKCKTIRSSFRATGIEPFNPKIVLDKQPEDLPVLDFERDPYADAQDRQYWYDEEELGQVGDAVAPEEEVPQVPDTAKAFKSRANAFLETEAYRNMPSEAREELWDVLTGGLILARAGELSSKLLARSTAAETARRARRVSRNIVAEGGMVNAATARAMAATRAEEELAAAHRLVEREAKAIQKQADAAREQQEKETRKIAAAAKKAALEALAAEKKAAMVVRRAAAAEKKRAADERREAKAEVIVSRCGIKMM